MTTLEHKNLFDYADKAEVYDALQRDYNRDTYIQLFWQLVLLGSTIGASLFAKYSDWLWLFLGLYAVERALSHFIDNSTIETGRCPLSTG
jgi:hypothetical protein